MLICGPCHPFAGRQSVALSKLSGQDFYPAGAGAAAPERFETLLDQAGISVRQKWVCHSSDSILAAVAQGQGALSGLRQLAEQSAKAHPSP